MTENQNKPLLDGQFVVYPKRFFIVGIFALCQMMISILVNTMTPIAAYLTQIYNESAVVVNLGSLLFTLMHPIFTFPASYVIDTFGSRIGIGIGCSLALLGVGLRLLINEAFAWVIVGQVIAGIGRPFILNCQAKISANWFTSDTRGGITQLLTLILNVSLIAGILIPGIIFSGYQVFPYTINEGRQLSFKLMWIEAAIALVCFVPNIIFQDSKPPTPPSESGGMDREPFSEAMPQLAKNKNYMLLLFAFFCYFGIFNALCIILSYLIKPWFAGDNLSMAVAAVGGSPVISGIIGVLIIGYLQRKEDAYKKWIIICMIGSIISVILFYPLLQTNSLVWASLISAINSFFLIPLVPIMLELGCEEVFPVGEGSAVGLLYAMGNLGGFVWGVILSLIVKGESKEQTFIGLMFCLGVFIVGFVLILFMKEQKNREKAEQEQKEKHKHASPQIAMISHENFESDKETIRDQIIVLKRDTQISQTIDRVTQQNRHSQTLI